MNDSFSFIQGETGPTGPVGVTGARGAPVSTFSCVQVSVAQNKYTSDRSGLIQRPGFIILELFLNKNSTILEKCTNNN